MTLQVTEPQIRHWTLAEYYQLAEEGWFQGQRVQLVEGEIIQMPAQGHLHCQSLLLISRWLQEAFGLDFVIRTQMPLNALPDSDPEPDIAVVRGPIEQFHDHPQTAVLVVEIPDSSLRLDRRKAAIYAGAGIEEYWIVNLNNRCVEIYRNPFADSSSSTGFCYPSPRIAEENESISPLAVPGAQTKVSDLLP